MSELSIFIDESGDFGPYDFRSPYYIITMVFHDQQEFLSFDKTKIYYDNGQIEISKILASVFIVMLPEVEIKRVVPSDYRLFQAADMFCSIELIKLKAAASALSASEMEFFGNIRDLKKNYLKPLDAFEWD